MIGNIVGALICLVIGSGVAFINYLISKHTLIKSPKNFSAVTVLRQFVQVGFLVLVYFIGRNLPYDVLYLLIGAVLGITISMFYFTKKLLKLNEASNKKGNGKEEDNNG